MSQVARFAKHRYSGLDPEFRRRVAKGAGFRIESGMTRERGPFEDALNAKKASEEAFLSLALAARIRIRGGHAPDAHPDAGRRRG